MIDKLDATEAAEEKRRTFGDGKGERFRFEEERSTCSPAPAAIPQIENERKIDLYVGANATSARGGAPVVASSLAGVIFELARARRLRSGSPRPLWDCSTRASRVGIAVRFAAVRIPPPKI